MAKHTRTDDIDGKGTTPARPVRKVRTTAGLGSGGLTAPRGVPVEKAYGGRRAMLRRQAEADDG